MAEHERYYMMSNTDNIADLLLPISPLPPDLSINEVGELFLSNTYDRLLSLPIVLQGKPVGSVSRYQLMQIYMKLYGREVYGRRPIETLMNTTPLIVDVDQALEAASQYVTKNIAFPITEDFIVTQNGAYIGVGMVVDLLKAMEDRVLAKSNELGKAYNRLKSSQAQLVQSEKMASLGQMVAGVAHEINTPLGYVRNNLEVVKEVFDQSNTLIEACSTLAQQLVSEHVEEQTLELQIAQVASLSESFREDGMLDDVAQLLGDTRYGIDQIGELVMNLKNFSRLDQAKVEDVDLNECLQSALNIANNVIKHKAEVIKRLGDIPKLACSPSQLNQVFLNLLTNAAQAMQNHGRILIESYADEHCIYISIKDNGKGIAKENLRKIFDPFFTTKAVGEGTGLGLSIAFQIIRQHKGNIKVASEPGKGTRFLLSFPRAARAQLQQAS